MKCRWCACPISTKWPDVQLCPQRDGDICEPKPVFGSYSVETRSTEALSDAAQDHLMRDLRQLMERMQTLNVGRLTVRAKDKSWTAVIYFRAPKEKS